MLDWAQADQAALQTKVLQSNAAVRASRLKLTAIHHAFVELHIQLSGLTALHLCRSCISSACKHCTANTGMLLLHHTCLTLPQIDQERQSHRDSRNREEQAAAVAHVTRLQQKVARLKQKVADDEAATAILQQRAAPPSSSQTSVDSGGTPRYGPLLLKPTQKQVFVDCRLASSSESCTASSNCSCLQAEAACRSTQHRCNGRAGEMVPQLLEPLGCSAFRGMFCRNV